ncbi:Protein ANTI-SILENCING 1 [Vigna angularis]|uniref:Protein ANTI-SILENCING 1 n=1 Tax=Phaseolus angularis TaxID=3914 RepID=A0A8T0KUZ6_PHAAN|nr:Protein ANTI-SILENCING 1 [Vigna angularis]
MAAPMEEDGLNYEFAWGRKRGMGGKKKDVRFYEFFTFDGVQYVLNDTIYLQNESCDMPHIGKLIKVWENHDKLRKVKKFLEGIQTKENKLFLACDDGKGFANVNPLEAIVGKCNVICISKNIGNSQPKDDFVFYRFFDVGQRKVVDQIDDKIVGTEVINISTK